MNAWRMSLRAGNKGDEMWPICRHLGVAAIQYNSLDDIDLSQYKADEPKPGWAQLEPSQKASIRRFVYEMQKGDIIYVKEGPMIVGKGVIIGDYKFDKKNRIKEPSGAYWQHQRSVNWSRGFFKTRIQIGKSQQFTIERITAEDIQKIEQKNPTWLTAEEAFDDEQSNEVDYVGNDIDFRENILRQIKMRRGQKRFRDMLLKRYNYKCLATGNTTVDVIEAAHIDPYRGGNQNHVANGLLLRADLHILFDLDLLGIEPYNLRIELHPDLCKDYQYLVGNTLRCTESRRPSAEALQRRYVRFQSRSMRPLKLI